jgi:1-acyl-sn-glycerol-3-phosphate acyltransferase
MSPWVAHRWYDVCWWLCYVGFSFGYSLRVQGRRNVPRTGPVLIISNHQSFLDPIPLGLAVPRYLTVLARDTLFHNRPLAKLMESLGTLRIDRDFGKEGLKATLEALAQGKCVQLYPEGVRSHDGEMAPFKAGVSLLIKKVKAPIVPVGMAGTFGAWSRHMKRPKFAPLFLAHNEATIAVSIGKPIEPTPFAHMKREEMLQKLHDAVKVEFEKAKRLRRQRRSQ